MNPLFCSYFVASYLIQYDLNSIFHIFMLFETNKIELYHNIDIKKRIYPSKLNSMTLHRNHLPTMMDSTSSSLHGSIAKSELGDGNNLQAKLVVILLA